MPAASDTTPLPTSGDAVKMVVLAISPRYARALQALLLGDEPEDESVVGPLIEDVTNEISEQLAAPAPGEGPQRRAKGLDDPRPAPARTKTPAEQIAEKMAKDALASTDEK